MTTIVQAAFNRISTSKTIAATYGSAIFTGNSALIIIGNATSQSSITVNSITY